MLLLSAVVLLLTAVASSSGYSETCRSFAQRTCSEPGESWTGGCTSLHGGFLGNSNNLHKMIVDDFTNSIAFLLVGSSFNTDVKHHLGFHKYFMEKSDKMWARGKDMMKYVLQRGGKMGNSFQVPAIGSELKDLDIFGNEIKSMSSTLDVLKQRADDALIAYMHAYKKNGGSDSDDSFDPVTAHMLEELSEDYAGEIREVAEKLNNLGRMVKVDTSRNLALHLFDKMLLA